MPFLRDIADLWNWFIATEASLLVLLAVLLGLSLLYFNSAVRVRESVTQGVAQGWARPAQRRIPPNSDQEVLVLRPTGRHYFFYLANAGIALWLGIIVLRTLAGGNPSPAVTLWFGLFCVFLGLWFLGQAVWLLRRIEVVGSSINVMSPLQSSRLYDLRELSALEPMPKTFRDGVRLRFKGKSYLDVPARYEGYKDLLTHLAAQRPQIMGIVEAADPNHK